MELRDIRYFLAVCGTLNFTRAAEQCRVTQPTLTRAVQKLEAELGGPLFVRERGHTHLTALGRLVQPRLEDIASRSRLVEDEAKQHHRLERSGLRLGVMCSIGPAFFADFLRRFRLAQPGIEVTLFDAPTERLAELLLQGDLDVALSLPPEEVGRLRPEPLYTERFLVACSPSHPFAARQSIRLRDMDGQVYLSRSNCEYRDELGRHLEAAGAHLVSACRSEREDWIQTLVAAGVGVCFLPEFSAVLPGLVLRPVEDAPVARSICLLTVSGRRWSAPLARFLDSVRSGVPRQAAQ